MASPEAAVAAPEQSSSDEKPPEQQIVLPVLTKGPAHFYDTETKAFWLGIPLGETDPLVALATLDRVKLDVIGFYAAQSQTKKIIKPGPVQRVGQLLSGVAARFRK